MEGRRPTPSSLRFPPETAPVALPQARAWTSDVSCGDGHFGHTQTVGPCAVLNRRHPFAGLLRVSCVNPQISHRIITSGRHYPPVVARVQKRVQNGVQSRHRLTVTTGTAVAKFDDERDILRPLLR